MKYKIPRGTFDILPKDSASWQYVTSIFRKTASSYGYQEITTPIFEQSDLFERSSGESSDVVQKEMYRFEDRKGRSFALRPEGTAPVVRSYVENNLGVLSPRTKLYYIGPMFRYDRPQAGRYRQFYQYGIEFIGSDHPYYDAEVIALEMEFLKALGLQKFHLEINSVGCKSCSVDYETALKEYFRPHLPELCGDCQTRFEQKPRRLLDCKVPSCRQFRAQAPSQIDFLDAGCKEHFSSVQQYLQQMKIEYRINPAIVRGLDYYTNTAFEFIFEGLGAQNTLAGGGRYNYLIEQIGGKPTPAIGFAGGFERLLLAMEEEGVALPVETKPTAYLICAGEAALAFAMPMLRDLRAAGIWVDYNADKTSFKAQMKASDQSGARFAIIIGEDELQEGFVTLKNLQSGEQLRLAPADLSGVLLKD